MIENLCVVAVRWLGFEQVHVYFVRPKSSRPYSLPPLTSTSHTTPPHTHLRLRLTACAKAFTSAGGAQLPGRNSSCFSVRFTRSAAISAWQPAEPMLFSYSERLSRELLHSSACMVVHVRQRITRMNEPQRPGAAAARGATSDCRTAPRTQPTNPHPPARSAPPRRPRSCCTPTTAWSAACCRAAAAPRRRRRPR